MEYRDIVDEQIEAMLDGDGDPFLLSRDAQAVRFAPLEEQVMQLARRDRLASLEPSGPIDRLLAFLFGLRTTSRSLADPRLEALRRATIVARHRHHLPDTTAAELRDNGFTLEQIHAIEMRAILG
jgi:hypothetical protein